MLRLRSASAGPDRSRRVSAALCSVSLDASGTSFHQADTECKAKLNQNVETLGRLEAYPVTSETQADSLAHTSFVWEEAMLPGIDELVAPVTHLRWRYAK